VRTEVHFHLLPGVDDGPRSVGESVTLARMAVADGTSTVVATPHARCVDALDVPLLVRSLQDRLDAASIPLRVVAGLEIAQDDVKRLRDEQLTVAAHGPPGRRWVLLEAPISGDPRRFPHAARELMSRGYGVLVAHPERCQGLMRAEGAVDALLAAGAQLQLNASSLIGAHGRRERAWALGLALSGRACVVSSDAHSPSRGPLLRAAVTELTAADMPREDAERLVSTAPSRLLEQGFPAALALTH
jgi:protein-tyrosine phosphatase